ncbi:MAG: sugar kinase [Caldilineae bacterium]|nr:MAG: sugar kinase [Caldilineae bacterium]
MSDAPAIDLLAIGETLVDFISIEPAGSLARADTFRRHLGGSPANIAVNMARLGMRTAVISKTGAGAFGQFLERQLNRHGVQTDYLVMDPHVRTSFIFIARTSGTPDFEPRRNGDYKLTPGDVPPEAIARARIVHASAFALSRPPCRMAVGKAFQLAAQYGKIVSLDPNYSPVIWPDYEEARQVIGEMFRYATITKASLDDARRFFGAKEKPETYLEMLHELGPQTVVLTMGREGALLWHGGRLRGHLPARPLTVADATGAGDAFWAGYLTAMLDGHPPERCLLFAREVAERKLAAVGPLPAPLNRAELYARLPEPSAALKPFHAST